MIKRSITIMTLALALTTLCQAQSRKNNKPAFMGLLP